MTFRAEALVRPKVLSWIEQLERVSGSGLDKRKIKARHGARPCDAIAFDPSDTRADTPVQTSR